MVLVGLVAGVPWLLVVVAGWPLGWLGWSSAGRPPVLVEVVTALTRSQSDAVLLSLGALREASVAELVDHCRRVAEVLPLVGFYLQPAVGGRPLDEDFWRRFLEIERVVAIKVAPFNRYQTLDVVRAVAASRRASEVALYTGNDDAILLDLVADFRRKLAGQRPQALNLLVVKSLLDLARID